MNKHSLNKHNLNKHNLNKHYQIKCYQSKHQINQKNSLSVSHQDNEFQKTDLKCKCGEMPGCTCQKALLTVEAAAVLPFFVCFMVFIMYFFRILQVQAGVAQALQYAGRKTAAEYCAQSRFTKDGTGDSYAVGLWKANLYFQKQLKKQKCPVQYIKRKASGISLLQSDFSGDYVELTAVYDMKLPSGLLGNIKYRIVQTAKCRKWTGYQPGQDDQQDETWLYYTEHGTVYHADRSCKFLDLSIRGVTYSQAKSSRNQSGGKYYECERCRDADGSIRNTKSMVYITDYGDRYHCSLMCSSLKRTIYMIKRSKATEKRMCSKCGK